MCYAAAPPMNLIRTNHLVQSLSSRSAAGIKMIFAVVLVLGQGGTTQLVPAPPAPPPSGLQLTGPEGKIRFGPNENCIFKYNAGPPPYLESTCPLNAPEHPGFPPPPPPKVGFNFTGADQTYTVPNGVTQLLLKIWGAAGGGGDGADGHTPRGGSGAFVEAILSVTPGEVLTVVVGEGGWTGPEVGTPLTSYGNGGTTGNTPLSTHAAFTPGGFGGGLSGIANSDKTTWFAIAGGGGGASRGPKGAGGGGGHPSGLVAGNGYGSDSGSGSGRGGGGTQTAGGSGGTGGRLANGQAGSALTGGNTASSVAGAGGAGWFGGGAGAGFYNGGGGGSSYTLSARCSSVAHVNGETNSGITYTSTHSNDPNTMATHPSASDPDYITGIAVSSRICASGTATAPIFSSPASCPGSVAVKSGHGRIVIDVA